MCWLGLLCVWWIGGEGGLAQLACKLLWSCVWLGARHACPIHTFFRLEGCLGCSHCRSTVKSTFFHSMQLSAVRAEVAPFHADARPPLLQDGLLVSFGGGARSGATWSCHPRLGISQMPRVAVDVAVSSATSGMLLCMECYYRFGSAQPLWYPFVGSGCMGGHPHPRGPPPTHRDFVVE